MKSLLPAIFSAALIVLASGFSASASTYNISGDVFYLFGSDQFSGAINLNPDSVVSGVTVSNGSGFNQTLGNFVSAIETGPLETIVVDNAHYLLSVTFTTTDIFHIPADTVLAATLFDIVTRCRHNLPCSTRDVPFAIGTGELSPADISLDSTPLPATLPLLATGLGLVVLLGRMKRSARASTAAAA